MEDLLEKHLFATHAIAGSASIALGTALAYPLDSIKTLIQVGSGPGKQLTASQVVNRVLHFSGVSGLYSGLGWLTFGRTLGLGARFGLYELTTAFYKDGRLDNNVYVSEALMAGMAAGAIESLVSSPFELIKVRTQVTSASRTPNPASITNDQLMRPFVSRFLRGYTPNLKALNQSVELLSVLNVKHPDMMSDFKNYPWMITGSGKPPSVSDVRKPLDVVSLEGSGALWRGLRSGIARDSVFGGVFFSTWQFLHRAMLDWKAVGMDPEPSSDDEIGPLSPIATSLAAGLSGAVAAAASQSFDTAKSRSQCIVLPKYVSMERKLLRFKKPGKIFEKLVGIHPADRNILFRGIWWRMARSGIASSVIIGSYYMILELVSK